MPDTVYFCECEGEEYSSPSLEGIAEYCHKRNPYQYSDFRFYAEDSDGKRRLDFWEQREILFFIDSLSFVE